MSRPNLLISHSNAEAKIKNRISKGKKLLESKITTRDEWDNANTERKKWHEYNLELLIRLVDTDDLVTSYDPLRAGSIPMNPTVADLRERFLADVKYYLGNLEAILERLELIPEAKIAESSQTLQEKFLSKSPKLQIRKILYQTLSNDFSEDDLKTLCFHLGVDYDALSAVGKNNKARELITFLEKRDRIPELIREGKEMRPKSQWEL